MKGGFRFRWLAIGALSLLLPACDAISAAQQENTTAGFGRAKNVILFIGDGMGISTVTAIRILDGQLKGQSGEENVLAFETFPHVALSKTYNTNQQIPDSAGTATAIMTGIKTKAGFINVGPEAFLGDCRSSLGQDLPSLAQRAKERGLAAGVVTTARVTHATPATVYSHVPHRDWESDAHLPEEALEHGCHDIARQLVEWPHGGGLDVVMGGGRLNFLPETAEDPGYPERKGLRRDGRDLTAEWVARTPGAAYIWNLGQFEALDAGGVSRLLALFNPSHMEYDRNRGRSPHGEPSLAEMTDKAITLLSRNEKGYFLMVEGGRIDHGHHAGNAYHALHDGVAFNEAVARALALTDPEETLILVTADHSHTFAIAGYATRGNPILGKSVANDGRGEPLDEPALADDGKPYTTLGYYAASHAADAHGRTDLTGIDTAAPDYRQQSAVPFSSGRHGGEDVAVYAHGAGAERVYGVIEQSRIHDILSQALFGE